MYASRISFLISAVRESGKMKSLRSSALRAAGREAGRAEVKTLLRIEFPTASPMAPPEVRAKLVRRGEVSQ